MPAPAADGTGGKIKQIIIIKDQIVTGSKKIEEKRSLQVNRGLDIDPVVAEVNENDPFIKGQKRRNIFIIVNLDGWCMKKRVGFPVRQMGSFFFSKLPRLICLF